MADYKISLGTELRTNELDKQVKDYKGKINVGVNTDSIIKGINTALSGYKASPIEVGATLNTQGVTDKISSLSKKSNRKNIKVGIDPDFTGVNTKIESYEPRHLDVKVDLNWTGVAGQIKGFTTGEKVKLDAELNSEAIDSAIKNYQAGKQILIDVAPNFDNAETMIKGYTARNKLNVEVKLLKGSINDDVAAWNKETSLTTVILNAKIKNGALSGAIAQYQKEHPSQCKIPIDLTLGKHDELDQKLNAYKQAKEGTYIPVRLIPASKDFNKGINKPIKLGVILDSDDISKAIATYEATPVPIAAKLIPAKAKFSNEITKTPIKIEAELAPDAINNAIASPSKPFNKISLDVQLAPKDIGSINKQVKQLKPLVTEALDIDVKLNDESINSAIAKQHPSTPLNVNVKLLDDDINKQIEAMHPTAPIKVDIKVNDSNIDEKTGKQNAQEPILVNVRLDRNDINKQIKTFEPTSKIKVGVKLDFATHKDKDTKETIQKGISQQIKEYETKTKVRVGVELDRDSVNQAVQGFDADSPLKLGVELDLEPAKNQTEELKKELQKFGKITVNFGNNENDISRIDSGASGGKISNVAQQFREVDIEVSNATDKVEALKKVLNNVGFSNSSIDTITKDFEELEISVKNVTSRLHDNGSVTLTVQGVDQLERTVKIIKRIDAEGNVVNLGTTVSQNFRETEAAFKRLKDLGKEIGQLDFKIAKLDTENNKQEIAELTAQLNKLEAEYNELFDITEKNLSLGQIDELAQDIANSSSKIDAVKAKLVDAIKGNIKGDFSKYNAELLSLGNRLEALADKPPEVKAGIESVRTALESLKSADGTDELIAANTRYKEVLAEVKTQLDNLELAESGSNYKERFAAEKEAAMRRLNSLYGEGSEAAKKYGNTVAQLQKELDSCGNIKGIQSVTKKINALGTEIKKTNVQTQTFGERIKTQFAKYSSYFSVASVFMYASQGLRSMFEQVKLIDSAMTELKKVTNETDASYNKFLSNAASRSKELGTTIDGLVSSTADFARLGYSFKESQGLAEVANIYAVVGDEIEGVEDATQSLVSTMTAFKSEIGDMSDSEFALGIVDKMNEVANNYAISSGGIGEALQRSASSMAAANNTLDETIALITAANEVAQNPEKVGNAMKTKFLYHCLNVQKCA